MWLTLLEVTDRQKTDDDWLASAAWQGISSVTPSSVGNSDDSEFKMTYLEVMELQKPSSAAKLQPKHLAHHHNPTTCDGIRGVTDRREASCTWAESAVFPIYFDSLIRHRWEILMTAHLNDLSLSFKTSKANYLTDTFFFILLTVGRCFWL